MIEFRWLRPDPIHLITVVLVGTLVAWTLPQDLSAWRSMAIVTGWVGSGLLLVSLLLMIREPWLASWLGGLEPMYLWHHRLGIWAYLFLLLHPLALAADAWNESAALAWSTLAPWQQGWPVWLGWASLLSMMAGLAVSLSPKLAYATWRKLHHLLTLAVLLGGAHLVLLGLEAPVILAPLLAVVFLLWRLLRADYGLAAKPYVVESVKHQTQDLVEVSLRPLAQPIAALPGQFVVAAFFNGGGFQGCGEYHPYTLSAIAADGHLSLGIKALGDCTRHIQSVTPGVAVRLQGPFGKLMTHANDGPSLWLAGGIGITPFLARLRSGPLTQVVRLIYMHRNVADAAYLKELDELTAQQPLLRLTVVASGAGQPDLHTLLPTSADLNHCRCYLCGPVGMVHAAVAMLRQRGVPAQHIHFERFDFR
jgi:predicted ferric reductase